MMRDLTIAEKSLLVGDEAADASVSSTAHLGRLRTADHVSIRVTGVDDAQMEVQLMLNGGTLLAVERTDSEMPEPAQLDLHGC